MRSTAFYTYIFFQAGAAWAGNLWAIRPAPEGQGEGEARLLPGVRRGGVARQLRPRLGYHRRRREARSPYRPPALLDKTASPPGGPAGPAAQCGQQPRGPRQGTAKAQPRPSQGTAKAPPRPSQGPAKARHGSGEGAHPKSMTNFRPGGGAMRGVGSASRASTRAAMGCAYLQVLEDQSLQPEAEHFLHHGREVLGRLE